MLLIQLFFCINEIKDAFSLIIQHYIKEIFIKHNFLYLRSLNYKSSNKKETIPL